MRVRAQRGSPRGSCGTTFPGDIDVDVDVHVDVDVDVDVHVDVDVDVDDDERAGTSCTPPRT
jgi:cytoskeletal protein CcmA (bactofilin family)